MKKGCAAAAPGKIRCPHALWLYNPKPLIKEKRAAGAWHLPVTWEERGKQPQSSKALPSFGDSVQSLWSIVNKCERYTEDIGNDRGQ